MSTSISPIKTALIKACNNCQKEPTSEEVLKTCGKCKSAFYCSLTCQKADWPSHKKDCQAASESKIVPISPEPTTTAYLRFFNIWLDVTRKGLQGPGKDILIFGPGLSSVDGVNHCPQLAEALRMWDLSRFTVLDSNQQVLDEIPRMNHIHADQHISTTFEINKKNENLDELQAIKNKMTDGKKRTNTVGFQRFRMGTDNPIALPAADVILATYSLYYPLYELSKKGASQDQKIDLFISYLSKLKKKGVLYIDSDCFEALLYGGTLTTSLADRHKLYEIENLTRLVDVLKTKAGASFRLQLLDFALGEERASKHGGTNLFIIEPPTKENRQNSTQIKTVAVFERRS